MEEVKDIVLRGVNELGQGNPTAALRFFTQALALNENDPSVYDKRGQIFAQIGELDKAAEDFRRAAELDPTADRCYRYGVCLSHLGRYNEALSQLEKAVTINPNHVESITEQGVVRLELGRTELALEDFEIAIRLDPTYYIAAAHRARCHYIRGEWRQVVENAARAIELNPQYALSFKLRALGRKELEDFSGAIDDLERYFSLELDCRDRLQLEKVMKQLKKRLKKKNRRWLSKLLGE
jgi:tetratricopeptide (TPR) repeat protein